MQFTQSFGLFNKKTKGGKSPMKKSEALGVHILIELRGCNPKTLNDLEKIKKIMLASARKAKAAVLDTFFHQFPVCGVTGVIVIAESHISIHTWPEHAYAAVDIFTCGPHSMPEIAAQHIIKTFKPKRFKVSKIYRGILSKKELNCFNFFNFHT